MRALLNAVVIISIIVLAVASSIPWLDGYLLKQRYQTYLSLVQTSGPDKNLKFTLLDYQEGWLSSTAKIRIDNNNSPITMTIDQNITHGPYLFDNTTK